MMEHAHRLKIGHDRPPAAPRIVFVERNQMIDLAPGRRHVAVGERARAIGRSHEGSNARARPIGHRGSRRNTLSSMAVGENTVRTLGLFGNPPEPACD